MSGIDAGIIAVNLAGRVAHTADAECPITNMFDADGDETDDPKEAVSAVAKMPDGDWASIDLSCFTSRPN